MESDVGSQSAIEVANRFEGTDIVVTQSEEDLLDAVGQSRTGRSFWFLLLLSVLGLLVVESLLAVRQPKRSATKSNSTPPVEANTENA